MKCLNILLALSFAFAAPGFSVENIPQMVVTLKPRQPNWRHEIVDAYANGQPKKVIFYEPTPQGEERAVKQMFYYENGALQVEMDVVLIKESEPGFSVWNTTIVPHGPRLEFTQQGELQKVGQFDRGLLNGEVRTLFPKGAIQALAHYSAGQLQGPAEVFYEGGQKKEEAHYENGQLSGECIQYTENGARLSVIPHIEGAMHGMAMEWYPSGALKAQRQFSNGKLHGDGKNPALVVYDEKRHLLEVCDFRQGQPTGLHIRYHDNGKESYRVNYRNGKKEGREQSFGVDGALSADGLFKEGRPVGNHWRNHADGKRAMTAGFDENGNTFEPVQEYNEEGVCIRKYSLENDKRSGPYTEYFADGSVKVEYCFAENEYDGEQKEYYPSGQIKTLTHFKNGKRTGIHEEWHENGIFACRIHFSDNAKDGQTALWYPNGLCKSEGYFVADQPDGILSEWYENGQLMNRAEYLAGVRRGWYREWNDSGDLLSEAFYNEEGLSDGTALSWWNKDQIRSRLHFKNGEKEGPQEWFYENGQPERYALFGTDLMEGEWKSWYPDGSLRSIQHFCKNKPIGEHCEYYPREHLKQKDADRLARLNHFDEGGKLHGEEKSYYPDHSLQSSLVYDHGVLHGNKQLFDQKGVLIEEANYARGKLEGRYFQKIADGREIVFHYKNNLKDGSHAIFLPPNEKGEKIIALEGNFERDLLQGLLVENNEKGKKVAETLYVDGKKEGLSTLFDLKGKITATTEFRGDFRNGLVTQFFPSGTVFRTTPYTNDLRNGDEKTYFESGRLASICPYRNDRIDGLNQNWNADGILVFEAEYRDGLRNGKFNKYYDDGKPLLEQTFALDQPQGVKKKYDQNGHVTVTNIEGANAAGTAR